VLYTYKKALYRPPSVAAILASRNHKTVYVEFVIVPVFIEFTGAIRELIKARDLADFYKKFRELLH
jgi:hypothetical protein